MNYAYNVMNIVTGKCNFWKQQVITSIKSYYFFTALKVELISKLHVKETTCKYNSYILTFLIAIHTECTQNVGKQVGIMLQSKIFADKVVSDLIQPSYQNNCFPDLKNEHMDHLNYT